MKIIISVLACALLVHAAVVAANTVNIGKIGAVYPIVERDALEKIGERVANLDPSSLPSEDLIRQKHKDYRPPQGLVSLPRAEEDTVRHVDPTYTWDGPDIEIPCSIAVDTQAIGAQELQERCVAKWGEDEWQDKTVVLYPSGFTFNPLDYIKVNEVYVIINGDDFEQVAWLERSGYLDKLNIMLLLSEGGWVDMSERLMIPIFYADTRIVERFELRAVPSVVSAKGRVLEVREFDPVITKEKKEKAQ